MDNNWDGIQYFVKWAKLLSYADILVNRFKAAGCDSAADELKMIRDEFNYHISIKSNGEVFRKAWEAVAAMPDKWEETVDNTDWDEARPKDDAEWEQWNAFKLNGDDCAQIFESEMQRLTTITKAKLQVKYDEAVKRWEAAKKATEDADGEVRQKWKLTRKKHESARKYHLVWSEVWKAKISFLEKGEQEWAAECEKWETCVNLMIQQHGVDSDLAQIARYRSELTSTKEFTGDWGFPHCTKWYQLIYKSKLLYRQFKVAGCSAEADEVLLERCEFDDCIKKESNGEAFCEARCIAQAMLNTWEKTNNRTAWDKTKPEYDDELNKWNEFKPKGEQYAKKLEAKINSLYGRVHLQAQTFEGNVEQKNKRDKERKKLRKLEKEVNQKLDKIRRLKKRRWRKKIRKLKGVIKRKKKEIDKLIKDGGKHRNRIRKLRAKIQKYYKRIQNVKDEVKQRRQKIKELEREVAQGKKKVRQLRNTIARKDEAIRERGRPVKELGSSLELPAQVQTTLIRD
ncbi:uncharacterized protein TM35_000212610 [Trypanosoma theileri]|uniref:Uncharacterized protein n=1 Tax=Trypanosoma theileri TaxID=67003 RepID=A0A1X0NSH1_9TRYP|nr:uncharacterized protein TM35_000212610 [Trypanosoma theileri]ORC87655.1 hypothetical protein TM35_000212610 [Trypanosoma theileri]